MGGTKLTKEEYFRIMWNVWEFTVIQLPIFYIIVFGLLKVLGYMSISWYFVLVSIAFAIISNAAINYIDKKHHLYFQYQK